VLLELLSLLFQDERVLSQRAMDIQILALDDSLDVCDFLSRFHIADDGGLTIIGTFVSQITGFFVL
jgi:hypothetical protein